MLPIQYIFLIVVAILIVSIILCCGLISVHKSTQWNMGILPTSRVSPLNNTNYNNNNDLQYDTVLYVTDDPYLIPSDIHNI